MSMLDSNFTYRQDFPGKGYVIETFSEENYTRCSSWLLLPAENLWNDGIKATLYMVAMAWVFAGIAIASDIFMCSIEVITSRSRTLTIWDEERQERVEKTYLVWNETVANLTLMALGSSAPEILLALVETSQLLPPDVETAALYAKQDGLGVFTIMGSAAFNLLIITAVCIVAPDLPAVKYISQFSVFVMTSMWSLFAYVWMLLCVQYISPNVIEPWEAWVTLLYFPVMVLTAYAQDNGWWVHLCCKQKAVGVNSEDQAQSHMNVRIVDGHATHGMMHGPSRELKLIEHQKEMRRSHGNMNEISETGETAMASDHNSNHGGTVGANDKDVASHTWKDTDTNSIASSASRMRIVQPPRSASLARARFRHAVVMQMTGGKKDRPKTPKPRMLDIVEAVRLQQTVNKLNEEDMCGKFTFSAPTYSVLESAGYLEVDVLFHRKSPSKSKMMVVANGNASAVSGMSNGTAETALSEVTQLVEDSSVTGIVAISFETREGSAKVNRDFKFSSGKLVFKEDEFRHTIKIPIVNDNQFEPDSDFYVLLKNPEGDCGIGDPNIARVTIIDDDEPGEFLFEKQQYLVDNDAGQVTLTIVRKYGCDGEVSIEYDTVDGTAHGGDNITGSDYVKDTGKLTFKHGETSKQIVVETSKVITGSKNFIVSLRNYSLGAKIGIHSAAVVNFNTDILGDRIMDALAGDDDEDVTWAGQFRNAMTLSPDDNDDGTPGELGHFDYIVHFLSMPWKIFCAFIPPKHMLGAYPCFVMSIMWIGIMTAIVEQLAKLFGCVVGLNIAVTGITFVAFGTSVPDTFASRTAAKQDEYADAAIGNITGSNSVNVFLGLGLPWVLTSMYYKYHLGIDYGIPSTNLLQAVIVFLIVGTIALILLFVRRKAFGGELGGNKMWAWACSILLLVFWCIFVLISALVSYNVIDL